MITMSKEAAEKFRNLITTSKNPGNTMVRVSFGGFGWGGPSLQLTLDELKNNEDKVVESEGISIVYESYLEDYIENSVIEYSNSWFQRGFVIKGGKTSSC